MQVKMTYFERLLQTITSLREMERISHYFTIYVKRKTLNNKHTKKEKKHSSKATIVVPPKVSAYS